MFEKITFSSGRTENVYPVAQLLLARLDVLPEFLIDADDPIEVVIEKQARLETAKHDLAYLLAFRDVRVPDDWQFSAEARAAGLEPREGDDGRKVDYIEQEILLSGGDAMAAQAVMLALTDSEAHAIASLFQPCRFAAWCPFSPSRRRKRREGRVASG